MIALLDGIDASKKERWLQLSILPLYSLYWDFSRFENTGPVAL